ncbi:MLP-like protein 328 [Benincasa hispida]|uniref:MLP-like protein 328 n=1 Tax=Benincasa hispida TaxID=102211 RepID=UPI0019025D16|nr:MLP-like protein 328 [Benincasa hispida]
MSLPGKLVSEVEINASAEKCYKIFKDQLFHFPIISPKFIKQVDVHDGDWDTHGHGSTKSWNYHADGKVEVFKERVEFDDENLKTVLVGLDGDPFNHYEIFTPSYQFVPKGPNHCLAIITLEYKKLDDDGPNPYKYIKIMDGIIKDVESHLK